MSKGELVTGFYTCLCVCLIGLSFQWFIEPGFGWKSLVGIAGLTVGSRLLRLCYANK